MKDQAEYNEYMRNYMNRRYEKRRAAAITACGGKCARCEGTDDLEFHHIDPTTKVTTIARASSFSEERWQAELAKCELLCQPCHKKEHRSG